MRSFDKNTTTNETRNENDYEIIKRIRKIIQEDKETQGPLISQIDEIEEVPFYKNKYFIIGAASVSVIISWYYFDEIKTGYASIIDWINSFRPTPPDSSTGNNSSNSTTPTRLNIQSELDRLFPENTVKDIELIDIKGKGKSVLTSPSLEDLNQKAADSWGESSSPQSDSSSSTITPNNFIQSNVIQKLWKLSLNIQDIKNINFIENTFSSEDELTKKTAHKLVDTLAELINTYNIQVRLYSKLNLEDANKMREALYHFRKWISNYNQKILPNDTKISIGNINDIPIEL